MSVKNVVSSSPIKSCLNGIQHRLYDVRKKVSDMCSTENKVHAFLVIGRVLQAAALISLPISIAFTFLVGPVFLIASVSAIAIGVLGTYVADNSQQVVHCLHPGDSFVLVPPAGVVNNGNHCRLNSGMTQFLETNRPFVPGQPIGLTNSGNNCWLNSSLQLLINAPSFHQRLRQIPEFSQFLDHYAAARGHSQKVARTIDSHAIRQFLSRETTGQITAGHIQEDSAQLFEYLFGNPNALYQLEQQLDGEPPMIRGEPMIQINLDSSSGLNFQQLFNHYFDHHSDMDHHIQLFFLNPPDALLIQVKRFYQRIDPASGVLMQGKINDLLKAPERLTLFDGFVRSGERQNYMCDGFTIHHGQGQDNGHYTCYLNVQGAWWYLSDSTVYQVPEYRALEAMATGYIFHYSRADIPSSPQA